METAMRLIKWTGTQRALIGLATAVLLFLGLTGMVRFPAAITVNSTKHCLPEGVTEEDAYVQRTDCWGIPFIFRSCGTDWEQDVALTAP